MLKAYFSFEYSDGETTGYAHSDVRRENDLEAITISSALQVGHRIHPSFFDGTSYESVANRLANEYGGFTVISFQWGTNRQGYTLPTITLATD